MNCNLFNNFPTEKVPTPIINPTDGVRTQKEFQVVLSCSDADASIYYTTDGTNPSKADALYVEPVNFIPPATIKAVAVKQGFFNSEIVTAEYTIPPKVVINEVLYDHFIPSESKGNPKDTDEFIELFNAGTEAVDISGYSVTSFYYDSEGTKIVYGQYSVSDGLSTSIMLPPGDFYVLGSSAVPTADQVLSNSLNPDLFYDDEAALELRTKEGVVSDTLCYENRSSNLIVENKEGRVFGNLQGTINTSLARYTDGLDTGRNGFDFGVRSASPGSSNTAGVLSAFQLPDVDAADIGHHPSAYHGSYVLPTVIDPRVADPDGYNPSVISPSPQGGKALVAWDPTGGVNTTGSDHTYSEDASFTVWVYIDVTAINSGFDTWDIGICGSEDGIGNTGNTRGTTGVSWYFMRDDLPRLSLRYYADGGTPKALCEDISFYGYSSGWYKLGISVSGTAVTGVFDNVTYTGTIDENLQGNFFMSYREAIGDLALCRPPTIDSYIAE